MNVSAQLARNSGLRVRINRKVATTAADSNKQGDVQAIEFGIPGHNDVSLVSDRIANEEVSEVVELGWHIGVLGAVTHVTQGLDVEHERIKENE